MINLAYFEAWLSLVERCVRDAEVVGSNPVASTTWQGQPRRSFTDLRGSFFCSEVTCRHGSLDESTKNSYFAFLSVFLAYGSTKSNFDCFPVESFARTVPTKFAIVSFLVKDCA